MVYLSLTDKQREYIKYMLTNSYTDEKDQQALEDILRSTRKSSYTELTKSEASKLITKLIERDVEYSFVCGEKKVLERWMAHSFDSMGDSKACIDHCPRGVYIGKCEDFQWYEEEVYKELEDLADADE